MFLPPGSAVIELFPYHMHHTLYTGIAFNTGVVSFPIHASNGTIIWRRDPVGRLDIPVAACAVTHSCVHLASYAQPYFEHNCDEMVGIEVNYLSGYCRSHAVNYPFFVEPEDFEATLLNAMLHIGFTPDEAYSPA